MPAFRQALNSGRPIEPTGIRFGCAHRPQDRLRHVSAQHAARATRCPFISCTSRSTTTGPSSTAKTATTTKTTASGSCSSAGPRWKRSDCSILRTELVHCHDWTSGLVPAYLKTELCGVPPYDSIRSLMTIHNIAYQGNFWHWDMELTGIDWKYFNWRQMEFYGNLSFLKTRPGVRRRAEHRQPALRPGDSEPAAGLRPGRHPAAPPRRSVRHHQRRGLPRMEPGNRSLSGRPQLRRRKTLPKESGPAKRPCSAKSACRKSPTSPLSR